MSSHPRRLLPAAAFLTLLCGLGVVCPGVAASQEGDGEARKAAPQARKGSSQAKGKEARPRVDSLNLTTSPGQVEVSFRIDGAFDPRLQEKLDSGLEITFRHIIEVQRKRTFWLDKKVGAKRVMTTVVHDVLTRQYSLKRKINGGLVETLTTSDAGEMQDFMTRIEGVTIPLPEMPPDHRTEVRVRTTMDTRFWAFFPYDYQTNWARAWLPAASPEDEAAAGGEDAF